MKMNNLLSAGLLGLSLSLITTAPVLAQSKKNVVRVTSNQTSESIVVPLNRAIVLEADQSFAELSVANPGIADIATLSDRTIYVLGKTPGRTTLTLLGADGRLITNVNIVVNPDLAELKELINEIMPGEKVEIRAANDGVVISGIASSTRALSRVVELAKRYSGKVTNLATVGGSHQVMLKVRFAEMSRSVSKGLEGGISAVGSNTGAGVNTLVGGTGSTLAGGIVGAGVDTVGQIANVFNLGGTAVNVLLEALENKGLVRTLAEPNLVTISGNEARFLAGGEVPIPVKSSSNTITVDYKPFGVQMQFTPTVLDNNLINLVLETEVSEIDTGNVLDIGSDISLPTFTNRRASTVVEMRDGESIAIAGLLQDNFTDSIRQVPWIGDIPILGTLFKSTEYLREQTELVIIVTPHLVTPVDGDSLILPTDRVRIPTESELFLLSKTGKTGGKSNAETVATQDFNGSYGYVLE
jgi:pilus assembly protein CpaC